MSQTIAAIVGSVGGIMQIVGVGLVLWDIADVERLFHLPPWHRGIRDWLSAPLRWLGSRRRHLPAPVVVQVSGTSVAISGGRARVSVSYGPTLEGRIATVEARLAAVDQDLAELRTRLTDNQDEVARRVAAVEESQRVQIASVHKLVKALSADSIRRRLWGVIFIGSGTLLTIVALWLPVL